MKSIKFILVAVMIATSFATVFTSCKKGEDDPIVSLRTRNDRFTNTWTLVRYEKNSVVQDLGGSSYVYKVFSGGTLNRTIEGSVFGFPTKSTADGTWAFMNDDEDVRIIIGSENIIYNIQRLANKELWIKKTDGADVHVYYFEGQ